MPRSRRTSQGAPASCAPVVEDGEVLVLPAGSPRSRRLALDALGASRVIAIPTDTVYGLAARLEDRDAIAAIFSIKGRSQSAALPVLVSDARAAKRLSTRWTRSARALSARYWPGPLTIVVDADAQVASLLGGDGASVGVRVPRHRAVRRLLKVSGPLAVTSANRSGEEPAHSAAQVASLFDASEVALVLDGGVGGGVPSSVVDCRVDPPVVVREGALDAAWIFAALR